MGTQHSLTAISLEMERQKRDAQSRQEQDRVGGPPSEPGDSPAWRSPCPRGRHGSALGKPPDCVGSVSPSRGVPIRGRQHGSALGNP